ncbi:uncharacterized protein EHS24_008977 [Apiotrichum porosum]|uniref:AB hydrolase-1 domain-containing protein n=1 Tax=Apiotrichum porosum TaxID=105984 RepID=A0A427XNJ0_9TREE|nr:uncharacterized protein EHS24_008977 [Apiotrichum porosum]RSH80400.1 hypothetical protein EHS24_008977 [Apiotrichum porosum]
MPPSLHGVLSLYPLPNSTWQQRPYFTSGDLASDKAVVFIGGLYSGLFDTPFLVPLSNALTEAKWRLVQIFWSGCYDGFGTGGIDRDRDELAALVKQLIGEGVKTVVVMGHSTGSQDALHYLSTSAEPAVHGAILVSPASDRQFFEKDNDPVWKEQLVIAQRLIAEGKGEEMLGEEMTKAAGARMTANRVFNLIGVGGLDDYFSSDLPDAPDGSAHVHPLSTSFGSLKVPALAFWAENDHCNVLPDHRVLLRRWETASSGRLQWRFLDGATHTVEEEDAQKVLCDEVVGWLSSQFEQ